MSAGDPRMQREALIDAHLAHAHSARELGFWLYLLSDAVLFALLFATYGVMVERTAGGPDSVALFDLPRVFIETVLLLTSSLSFAFADLAAEGKDRRRTQVWLGVTLVLGAAFLVLELMEFAEMVLAGAGPGRSGFLSAFFTLVGTHGLHVAVGLVGIGVMLVQIRRLGLDRTVRSRLHRLGLFWHFLDIVWVGVFTFVYLAGSL